MHAAKVPTCRRSSRTWSMANRPLRNCWHRSDTWYMSCRGSRRQRLTRNTGAGQACPDHCAPHAGHQQSAVLLTSMTHRATLRALRCLAGRRVMRNRFPPARPCADISIQLLAPYTLNLIDPVTAGLLPRDRAQPAHNKMHAVTPQRQSREQT